MLVDQNTYNSPAGKIDLNAWGTIAYTDAGVTRSGSVNDGVGTTYAHGSALAGQYLGNLDTWAKLLIANSSPVYIKYTPSGTLPASCMVAVKAQFDGAVVDSWNGMGEVAVYGRFSSDDSDIRLLMFMGVQTSTGSVYQNGGWLTPGDEGADRSLAFIVHYRNIFTELSWLLGKTWPDVKDVRLVFRNQTDGRKVKIEDFHIYESVSDAPSGTVTDYSSTTSSITFEMSAEGALSTVGAGRSGISKLECQVVSPTASLLSTYPIPTPVTTIGDITLTDLPVASRSEWITLYDTYGNVGYVVDSYGCQTTINGSFTVTTSEGWATAEISASLTDTSLFMRSYCFYQEKKADDGVVSMVPIKSEKYDVEPPLPHTDTYTADIDPTGGAKFRVLLYARGTISGRDYFFEYDETITLTDTRQPVITPAAYSAQNHGFVSIRARDASGIKSIEYVLQREGQEDLSYITRDFSAPYLPQRDDSMDFVGNEGELVTVLVKVTDGADNLSTISLDIVIYGGGDIYDAGYIIAPDIKAAIGSDGHVLIEWTTWAAWMPAFSGVRYPPLEFEIFRKTEASGTYQQLADNLDGSTASYEDETLTMPAVYYYCIVGVDRFGQRKSVEIVVDVAAATTQTKYSFVENYLSMLPKWTAAIPKKGNT